VKSGEGPRDAASRPQYRGQVYVTKSPCLRTARSGYFDSRTSVAAAHFASQKSDFECYRWPTTREAVLQSTVSRQNKAARHGIPQQPGPSFLIYIEKSSPPPKAGYGLSFLLKKLKFVAAAVFPSSANAVYSRASDSSTGISWEQLGDVGSDSIFDADVVVRCSNRTDRHRERGLRRFKRDGGTEKRRGGAMIEFLSLISRRRHGTVVGATGRRFHNKIRSCL